MADPFIEPIEPHMRGALWFSDDGDDQVYSQNFSEVPLVSVDVLSNRQFEKYIDYVEPPRTKRKQDEIIAPFLGPNFRFKLDQYKDLPACDEQDLFVTERERLQYPSYIGVQEQETDLQTLLTAPSETTDPDQWFEPRDITDERQEPLIQVLVEKELNSPAEFLPESHYELDAFLQMLDNPAAFVGDDEDDFVAADAIATATRPVHSAPSAGQQPVPIKSPVTPLLEAPQGASSACAASALQEAQLVITVQPESRSYLKSSANDVPRVEVELQRVPRGASVGLVSVFGSLGAMPIENDPQPLNERHRTRFELRFGKSNCVQPCSVYFQVDITLASGERRQVQSALSEPFIMRTNISQFLKAERLLVSLAAFGPDACETAWPMLGASLSRHFFFTTGSVRTLASRDVRFMHRLLGGGERVLRNTFVSFWEAWYGQMARLFTDKNVRRLWTRRVVYGFVQRSELRSLLQSAGGSMRPGLFVLVFVENDSMPVVAWVHRDGSVRLNSLKRADLREPFRLLLGRASHLLTMLRPAAHSSTSFELTPKEDVMQLLRPKKPSTRELRACATPQPQPQPVTLTGCASPGELSEEIAPRYDDELN